MFGTNADKVIGTPDADLSRAELREKTGCVVAVRDVSIDVWPGEVFVVMGLSGSGKSTLVRTLIRLIEPTAGKITIGGQDVTRRGRRRSCASCAATGSRWCSSTSACSPTARVIDNVAFGLEIQGVSKAERLAARQRDARARRASHDVANSFPDQLSGGMQQRVGLARAFAVDPS